MHDPGGTMRRLVSSLALVLVAIPIWIACSAEPKEETADFKAQAGKLTAGKTDRIARFVAIHSFVRDQIAQVKTSFS
jgi:hypothetical protein